MDWKITILWLYWLMQSCVCIENTDIFVILFECTVSVVELAIDIVVEIAVYISVYILVKGVG